MARVTGMDVRLRSIAGPKQRELLTTTTETAQAAENKGKPGRGVKAEDGIYGHLR
jgi:hypothetical protein